MIFATRRRLRIAEEQVKQYNQHFIQARDRATFWQAQLFHSWKVIAAQQKGLNRQRRHIKRLQAALGIPHKPEDSPQQKR